MAINIRCKSCKAEMKLSAKKCQKCKSPVPAKGRIYKVIVRMDGQRITRTTHNLELAKEIESKLKLDISRGEHDLRKKKPAPTLNTVWGKYMPWAKENKQSWKTDEYYYQKHRKKVKKPRLNNQKTECLSEDELTRLLDVLGTWPDKMSAAYIKFAMFSGIRRGEQFKLTWNDIDFERKTAILRDPKGILDQTIPLSNEALQVLAGIPCEYETPYIFFGKKRTTPDRFQRPLAQDKGGCRSAGRLSPSWAPA